MRALIRTNWPSLVLEGVIWGLSSGNEGLVTYKLAIFEASVAISGPFRRQIGHLVGLGGLRGASVGPYGCHRRARRRLQQGRIRRRSAPDGGLGGRPGARRKPMGAAASVVIEDRSPSLTGSMGREGGGAGESLTGAHLRPWER